MAGFPNEPGRQNATSRFVGYLPIGLVVVMLAIFFATGSHRLLTLDTLVEHRAGIRQMVAARPLVTGGLYILLYTILVTLSIPAAALLAISGGFLFGWPVGGALAVAGASLGAMSLFLIARTSLGDPILRRAGTRIQKLAASFRADSFSYLLFLRLLPVMPFWATNLAAALFGMRFRTFALATLVGVIPISYAFAVAGSGLDRVISTHQQRLAACLAAKSGVCARHLSPESLLTPQLMIALGLLGILALGPILVRKRQARRKETAG